MTPFWLETYSLKATTPQPLIYTSISDIYSSLSYFLLLHLESRSSKWLWFTQFHTFPSLFPSFFFFFFSTLFYKFSSSIDKRQPPQSPSPSFILPFFFFYIFFLLPPSFFLPLTTYYPHGRILLFAPKNRFLPYFWERRSRQRRRWEKAKDFVPHWAWGILRAICDVLKACNICFVHF